MNKRVLCRPLIDRDQKRVNQDQSPFFEQVYKPTQEKHMRLVDKLEISLDKLVESQDKLIELIDKCMDKLHDHEQRISKIEVRK